MMEANYILKCKDCVNDSNCAKKEHLMKLTFKQLYDIGICDKYQPEVENVCSHAVHFSDSFYDALEEQMKELSEMGIVTLMGAPFGSLDFPLVDSDIDLSDEAMDELDKLSGMEEMDLLDFSTSLHKLSSLLLAENGKRLTRLLFHPSDYDRLFSSRKATPRFSGISIVPDQSVPVGEVLFEAEDVA